MKVGLTMEQQYNHGVLFYHEHSGLKIYMMDWEKSLNH